MRPTWSAKRRLRTALRCRVGRVQAVKERRNTNPSAGAELAVFEYGRLPGSGVPSLLLVHEYQMTTGSIFRSSPSWPKPTTSSPTTPVS